jgi:hypothetical protein
MKNLNIVTRNGFVFNNETQCLEEFVINHIEVNYHKGTVKYDCMLAGQHKVIDNDSLQVFVSKEGFRFGDKWAFNQDYAKFPNAFRAAFRYYPRFDEELDDYTTVCIVNGEATTVRMPEITFKFTFNSYGYPSVSVDDAPSIYPDVKTAYAYNDYTVNNADGSSEVHKSTASLVGLDDKQKALVDELKSVLAKLNEAKVKIMLDESSYAIHALSMNNIDSLERWGDVDKDTQSEILKDMMTRVGEDLMASCNIDEYGLWATFKPESKVVIK